MEMYLLGALEQESNQEDYWIPKKRLKQQAILVLELEIKHKHGGFNINYEKATVVWQQFGFGS
jgi:hypothetical protein